MTEESKSSRPTGADLEMSWTSRLTLLIAVIPAFATMWRIYVISNGNLETLKLLGKTLDIPSLLIGTYLPVFPTIVLLIGTFLLIGQPVPPSVARLKKTHGVSFYAISISLILLAFLAMPWKFPLIAIVGLALFSSVYFGIWELKRRLGRTPRTRPDVRKLEDLTRRFNGVMFGVLAVMLTYGSGMWLPRENFKLLHSPDISGFILDSSEEIVILDANGQGVLFLEKSDVLQHNLCDTVLPRNWSDAFIGNMGEPLFTLVLPLTIDTPSYPACLNH